MPDILNQMHLPPYEVEFLGEIAFLDHMNLMALNVLPLLAAAGLVLVSRKYFTEPGLN